MKLHQHVFGNGKPLRCSVYSKAQALRVYIYIYDVIHVHGAYITYIIHMLYDTHLHFIPEIRRGRVAGLYLGALGTLVICMIGSPQEECYKITGGFIMNIGQHQNHQLLML